MRPPVPFRTALLLLACLILATGCASVIEEDKEILIVASSEAFKRFNGEFENTAYFRKHKPARIAVLPFGALEEKSYSIDYSSENPAEIVRRGMYNHIASLPFKDLELYQTDQRLKNANITDVRQLETMIAEQPKKLKSILGVDAVFSGQVTHFDRIYAGIYSQIAVGCEVKFWDLNSGKLLWRAKHVQRAHAGGISTTPVGLVLSAMASMWNLRQDEMLSQTDDLFREIVSTIDMPESVRVAQSAAPRIAMFAVVNSGEPFTKGKSVTFRLVGEPGGNAVVDLGDFKSGIPMTPVSAQRRRVVSDEVMQTIRKEYEAAGQKLTPELAAGVEQELAGLGFYEGSYQVAPNEEAYGLTARAYLVNTDGMQGQAVDTANVVDIDSLPPEPVGSVAAESLDGKVRLSWPGSEAEDLKVYEIWTSASPISGFTLKSKSEHHEAVLEDVENFDTFFVRVRAVDRAENKGSYSKAVESVALPVAGLLALPQPGPALRGDIAEKVLLTSEKSPYTVNSDLRVIAGGVLYLEPGVELRFGPDAALLVSGGEMMAYGNGRKPIQLVPRSTTAKPGAWKGVVFDGTAQSALYHVRVDRAATGVRVRNSAPAIVDASIQNSSQAGLHLQDNARPEISCTTFAGNQGQGAVVLEGAGLNPVIRNNTFLKNEPFQVQSYAPVNVDMSHNYWGAAKPSSDWFLGDITVEPALRTQPEDCRQP